MPDDPTAPLKHLRFAGAPQVISYRGSGRGKPKLFRRDRAGHAAFLQGQISAAAAQFDAVKAEREERDLGMDFGLILNIESEPGYPLKFTSFEQAPTQRKSGVTVLNVRQDPTPQGAVTKVALFVPFGRLDSLGKKIDAYADPQKDGKPDKKGVIHPKNESLLANVARIGVAALEALWTDPDDMPTGPEPHWWEVWVRRNDGQWEEKFNAECARLAIEVPDQRLVLPDHVILIAKATRGQLEGSLDLLNTLSEVRRPRPCNVGLTDLRGYEQDEWIDEAIARTEWPGEEAPAVCIIDTGANRGHRLLERLLSADDATTVLPDGDTSDAQDHGTLMAGLAAFGDLRTLMLSTGAWRQLHRLESVKLIATGDEHDPANYGAVTQSAIALPETQAPDRPRAYCLAITRGTPADDGRPSSWSAALDAAVSGSQEEGEVKRLLLVSAGNWREFNEHYLYPATLVSAWIEDPAQAWNAITVGAYTSRTVIHEDDDESRRARAIAPFEGLSPFSRTSREWEKRWPIKPEIVMEGGNLARSEAGDLIFRDSLELVTTSSQFRIRPLTTLNATSAATALASRVGARLLAAYPDLWTESLRGLIVHSARWTNHMLGDGLIDPHRAGSSAAVQRILRTFGFGAVNEERVLSSFSNRTTLVIQDSIQPYKDPAGAAKLNECHLIELPWPKGLFEDNPDHLVAMKVTLSYFIEPNPGSRVWERNPKYRYPGCLLRFKVKHRDMDPADFRARLEVQDEEDDEEDQDEDDVATTTARNLNDPGWAVGAQLRGKAGSLVQDLWKGTTGQLAEMGHVAVYPVKGWWATRKFPEGHEHHGCHTRRVRYSLIVSLETEANIPIYTKIEAAIAEIEVEGADIDLEI